MMRKLLYITADSKNECCSSCKTVARRLVDAVQNKDDTLQVEEVDLYQDQIPQLKGCYFSGRSAVVSAQARANLTLQEQQEVQRIEDLCNQFCSADLYILAAPMWSLSFPAPVKQYVDCIVQAGKTIEFENNKPKGLLDDRPRSFVYVQASGAAIPWMIRPALNKGLNYVHDIIRFIGIQNFEELLVDGTGNTENERQEAIQKATDKIPDLSGTLLKSLSV